MHVTIQDLAPGEWKDLSDDERERLLQELGMRKEK
jgi:hypothetical protein